MGLQRNDLKNLLDTIVEIDSYKSKMGEDADIVTVAFSVLGEEPAKDLENFVEKGYPFVLDADVTSGEQPDGYYKVFVEMERNKKVPGHIIEIIDGVSKLADVQDLRFRYHKNFKGKDLTLANLEETVPLDATGYTDTIKGVQMENYKNFFTNSYAEEITLREDTLTIKNTYQQPIKFEVVDFGKDLEIKESIDMENMAEVIFLTKYLGDYNINKFGDYIVLENQGYVLKLKRI